jgi:hypothetical protein
VSSLLYLIVSYRNPYRIILCLDSPTVCAAHNACLLKNYLLPPDSYFKLIFARCMFCRSSQHIFTSSAPSRRQTSIGIVHGVELLVCSHASVERANTTPDAIVRKDGLDTTAKQRTLLNLREDYHSPLWCLLVFSSFVRPESGLCVQHGLHDSRRRFDEEDRGRAYPAEQDFNVLIDRVHPGSGGR